MKAEIRKKEKSDTGHRFPVLMKSKQSGLVILFTSERVGFVIVTPSDLIRVGTSSGLWISCYDSDSWEKFNGEIVLSND